MYQHRAQIFALTRSDTAPVDVSIVMPCLNETISLPHCISNAQEALRRIAQQYGLAGEIVIADNGSDDGSQALATSLGARVVDIERRGYGAALIGGCEAALGDYILMGDCDGSYDFTEGVAMIGKLVDGHDLCMGSRFDGGIAKGAMPWKNRYIGNPVLTGILNLFFRSGINDAHCGLRAIRKTAFTQLGLAGEGMEFASEMVIKASLKKLDMVQVPATLSVDLRDRPPHLRPWRDGWRHLRYLLMLSPTWVFGVPALAALGIGSVILLLAMAQLAGLHIVPDLFGAGWSVVAAMLVSVGHMALIMALATHLHGVRQGYRRPRPGIERLGQWLTLERLLMIGIGFVGAGGAGLVAIAGYWTANGFATLPSIVPLSLACAAAAVGFQTIFGGFLMSILAGHSAAFGAQAVRGPGR